MARLHEGRRLSRRHSVADGRSCGCEQRRVAGARPLASGRRRMADHDAGRIAADRSICTGVSCQLLRGRRVRALERKTPADRDGMGSRRPCRTVERRLRHRLAVDAAVRTHPIPATAPSKARSANITANSWSTSWCCAAPRLQLRPDTAVSPIAISFIHTTAGNSRDCASPTTPEPQMTITTAPESAFRRVS